MPKLFQIHEGDLTELETTLPKLMHENAVHATAREKTQWRRVIEIIKNVRWNYGPWQQCEQEGADDAK